MHPTRTGSGSLVPSRHGWRRTTSPLSPPGTLCTAAVTNCTDRYVLGAKTTQTAPTDTCKRPAQILGVFLLVVFFFLGRAFGPNGPIRRAGPIGGIPRVLITDGPSRYGSIDTSLLYPRGRYVFSINTGLGRARRSLDCEIVLIDAPLLL